MSGIIEIINNVSNFTDCDDEYKCEICINLNISPIMLVPCGHTICEKCSEKIDICPFCRYTPTHRITNYALKKIIKKHNEKYFVSVENFISFFEPVMSSDNSIKQLLEDERLGTDLYERILTLEKLFELKENDNIVVINEEEKFGIYKHDNYYFVSYNDILMIDIDGDYTIEEIEKELNKTNESFYIYKTRNGYHAFMTSRRVNYHDKDTLKFMCSIDLCDKNYTFFTWLGKKTNVRINRKFDEDYKSGKLYEYVSLIGNNSLIDIEESVHTHNIFTLCFSDIKGTKGSFNKLRFLYDNLVSLKCNNGYGYNNEEIDEEVEELDDLSDELFLTTYGYTRPSWNV
jgi:hypothetical protein